MTTTQYIQLRRLEIFYWLKCNISGVEMQSHLGAGFKSIVSRLYSYSAKKFNPALWSETWQKYEDFAVSRGFRSLYTNTEYEHHTFVYDEVLKQIPMTGTCTNFRLQDVVSCVAGLGWSPMPNRSGKGKKKHAYHEQSKNHALGKAHVSQRGFSSGP